MRATRRVLVSGIAAAALLTAACGSIVPIEEQLAAQAAAEEGLSEGGLTVGGTSVVEGGLESGLGDNDLAESGSAGFSGVSGTDAVASRPTSSTTAVGENGPGVTDTTIKLGLTAIEEISEFSDSVGSGAVTGIDMRRAYDVLIENLNSRGGIGGREVIPVYHTSSALSAETFEQQDQEACAAWTQDDQVFAADSGYGTETLESCLEKAGAVNVSGLAITPVSDRFYARYPHYVQYPGIDLNDLSMLYVDSLYRMSYFTKDAKLGLVTFDWSDYTYATKTSFIPALQSHGLELTDVAYVKLPRRASDYGELSSQVSNVVLRFKGEDITRVMFLDGNAQIASEFTAAAERQQYRPRYGLTSLSLNTGLADKLGSDARSQLRGALSIGWVPSIDVHAADDPAFAQTPNRKRCHALMRKNGVAMTSRNAEAIAAILCDTIWFLEATLESAGGVINQDTFLHGLDRLGRSYVPALTFATSVSATRRDGLGAVANLKFFDGCACFRYTSEPFAVPN